VPLPAAISFVEAAGMAIVYDTAWFALRDRGRIKAGDNVLVLGATGGVGLAAIQLAKALGAKVLAAVASPDKADIVREAGADAVIDLSVADLHENLRAQVFAATDKHGADIVLDMLGGDIFDAAVRALAWCGRLVIIGFASGRIPSLKMNYLLVKNIEISGMQVSDYRKRRPADMQACFAEIYAWRAAGTLKPLPTKAYRFEDFAAAMKEIRDRTQRGRVVLTLNQ
jgi:NADPH2:quinone reductase